MSWKKSMSGVRYELIEVNVGVRFDLIEVNVWVRYDLIEVNVRDKVWVDRSECEA